MIPAWQSKNVVLDVTPATVCCDLSTQNTIANVRQALFDKFAVRATRKKFKWSYDGGDSGTKKYKICYGGAYGGVWLRMHLEGD